MSIPPEAIYSFLNSNFTSSILGALIGAGAGAFAATWFADKKERDRLAITRLQQNNTAVALAMSIANHSLIFKKQPVRDMCKRFKADRIRYEAYLKAAKKGSSPGVPFEMEYDFTSLTFFRHDGDGLHTLVIREVAASPSVTLAASQLLQTLHSLKSTVASHSAELVRLTDLRGKATEHEFAHVYFGLRTEHGINERYSDVMTSLEDLLEDTILFSTFIAEELSNRGRELAKQLGKKAPKTFSWSFREIEDPSLMPAESRRPDWMKSDYN